MTRAHLLLTSALVLAAFPVRAQAPAPNQLPTGMRIIAGQATAATSGNTLQVTQGSGRAAIDWSSFNIGSQATVRFHDPSSQSMTLNRVSGPGASMIAGRLTSNGEMVLINQSGVVFMPGAVVDAQSIVVSAAGITEAGMRSGVASGHFVLDQPAHPGAQVVNNGHISVARAGLAALVAPQVANHGTIAANFGTVSLQGVTHHVVDLYGDGLLLIDVSRQTVQDSSGQAALVTNDGLIAARGGTVLLSTDAVEGVVDNLVTAGGTVDASGGGRGGRVLIDARGGSAEVTGTLAARGGGSGGDIAVQASDLVMLQPGALVDASGGRAGGTVAIGTTLARARNGVGYAAPAAKLVGIADGARVSADALDSGQGGRITVLSSDNTVNEGLLTARGGTAGGNGGTVEVSGTLGLSLLGTVDVTALHGSAGHLVIDPTDLVVQSGGTATLSAGGTLDVEPPPTNNTATIDPNVLQAQTGDVTLISHDNIDVLSGFSLNNSGLLTMTATTGTITIGGAITNNGGGIVMTAGSDIVVDAAITAAGSVNIFAGGALTQAAGAPITSTGSFVALSAGGVMTLGDAISALTSSVNLKQATSVVQTGGAISASSLFSSSGITGAVSLPDGNAIPTIGTFTAVGGFDLTDTAATVTVSQPITVTNGPITINAEAGALSVQAALSTAGSGVITLDADTDITVGVPGAPIAVPVTAADALALTAAEGGTTGAITLLAGGSLTSTNNAVALSAGTSIALAGNVSATTAGTGSVNLEATGALTLAGGVTQSGGAITASAVFGGTPIGGSVNLIQGNTIGSIGTFAVTGGFALNDNAATVAVTQPITVTDGSITLNTGSGSLSVDAAVSTAGFGVIALSANTDITVAAAVTAANALTLTAAEGFAGGSINLQSTGSLTSTNNAIILAAGTGITLSGNVTATNPAIGRGGVLGTLDIEQSSSFTLPDGVTQTSGAIATNLVESTTGIGGGVSLAQPGNSFPAVGLLQTGGNVALVTTAPTLSITSAVQAGNGDTISIVAPQLVIGGSGFLTADNGVIELAPPSGAVTLGGAGGFSVPASDLTGMAANVLRIGKTAVGGQASSITVAGTFDTTQGDFTTLDLEAGAGGIAVTAGPLDAITLLLGTPGLVSQTVNGAIEAGTLESVGTLGTLELGQSSGGFGINSIGTLGPIAATGEINVANGGFGLSLVGPISASGLTLETVAGIALTGSVNVGTGTLSLTTQPTEGSSDVVWTTPITAGTITGNIDGTLSLIDNSTGTVSLARVVAQGVTIDASAGALTTTGDLSAGQVTLTANGLIDVASTVTANLIDLSGGSVAEDTVAGHLDGKTFNGGPFVGILTSTGGVGGAATMLGTNQLTQIQRFVAGGTLALANGRALTIGPGVGAGSATFDVTGGNALTINDPLAIPTAGTLSLQADNLVVAAGATADVVTNASGSIALIAVAPNSALQVTLGGAAVSSAGTLAISNVNFLLGALRASTLEIGGLPSGVVTASRVVVAGASLAPGITLLLDTDATGSLTQTAALTADTVGGSIGSGGVQLIELGNSIGTIDALAVAGNASLVDAAPLTIGRAFSAVGSLAIAADTFAIGTGGALSVPGGTVAIGPLDAGHTLGIGLGASGFDINLSDLTQITSATLEAGASGITGTATADAVTLAGNANLPGGALVLTAGTDGVAQTGGTLNVATLAGSASGGTFDVADALAGNTIAALGDIDAPVIDIADAQAVQVAGIVQATGGALTLVAPAITVENSSALSAFGANLSLTTDALSHVGTGLVADPLTIDIAPFSASALTVGPGHVDLTSVSSPAVVLTDGLGVTFAGHVTSGAPLLDVQAGAGAVSETSTDILSVSTLEGSAGSLSLPGANTVQVLAGFTVTGGGFDFVDSNLTVAASVSATNTTAPQQITLEAASLTLDPGVEFTTSFTSDLAALDLVTDNPIGSVDAIIPGGTVTLERLSHGPQSFDQSSGITADTLQIGGSDLTSTSLTLGTLSGLTINTLKLESSGAVTQTGSLVAPGSTLTGQAGSVSLLAGGNALAALGTFTAAGGFALTDSTALAVTGNVATGTAALSLTDTAAAATAVSLDPGTTLQAGALTLTLGAGGAAQDPTATIDAAELDGAVAGDLSLPGTANAIASIGSLSVTGQLALTDTADLTQAATGTLAAGTLSGTFGGAVTLAGTANAITTLADMTVAGTLALTDGDPTLAGTVQASAIALFVDGIGYASGGLTATGAAAPLASGARPFFAAAGTVEIAPRDIGILYLGASPVGGPFVSAGVLASVDAALLRLGEADGVVRATGIGVEAPVTVSSEVAVVDLEASTVLDASNPGLVTEAAGATLGISGFLTGNTGPVALTGANSIPVLGAYTVTGGDFALDDATGLFTEGNVAAAGITLAVNGTLLIDNGSLLAPGGTVDLTAPSVTQGSGIVVAATLDSSGSPGSLDLPGANQVQVLGTWNGSGSLLLVDDTGGAGPAVLTVAGPVSSTVVSLRAASIDLAGDVTSGGDVLLATTAGGITQTGGTLTAAELVSPGVGGDVLLGATGNAVGSLGLFAAAGDNFSLTDSVPLSVVGSLGATTATLIDPAGITVDASVLAPLITIRGGALAIGAGGALQAGGGTVDLVASGATETGGGFIQATTLLSGGTSSGAIVLGGANSIAVLGNFTMAPGGSLLLADTQALAIGGAVTADAVDLSTSAGGVSETTGSLATGLLSSSTGIVGGATLTSTGNAIAAIGNMAVSGGDLTLTQSGSLAVVGTAGAPDIVVRIGGSLVIGGTGTLQAAGTVDLTADSATEAATGAIVATVVDSSQGASGTFALTGANTVDTLDGFTVAAGGLSFNDTQALAVAGPISAAFVVLSAPSLTLAGNVTAQALQLATTAGGVTQTAGVLDVDFLAAPGGIAGPLSLPAANTIDALDTLSAQGTMALTDAASLIVIGPVSVPAGISLAVAGDLSEFGQGSLTTATLSGTAATATLGGTANAIGTLDFATSGALALSDATPLVVTALSGSAASLSVQGDLTLAGPVTAGGSLALAVTGAVSQSAGSVQTAQLGGTAGSLTLGQPGNAIATLGALSASGGLTLVDATGLTLTGAVVANVADLTVAGGLVETGGGELATNLLTSAGGIVGDTLLAGSNAVAAVGGVRDGGRFELADSVALAIGQVTASTLDLSTTAGGITETGPVTAQVLTSSFGIAGGAQFTDGGNTVATLGAMTVTGGDLALTDAQSLAVAGPIAAPNLTLVVDGNIGQSGDVTVPGTFSTTSQGSYQRSGGALSVGTLTGVAGSLADFGTGAAVQQVNGFAVHDNDDPGYANAAEASTFEISDGTALTLSGTLASDYVAVTATGLLTWSGTLVTLGLPLTQQTAPNPTDPGSYLSVLAGSDGQGQIVQTGLATVVSQDAFLSTVRLQTPATGGSISLADLVAPDTDLLVFLGSGRATGQIDVGDLFVSGRLGGASFTGTVRGLVGQAAAREASLAPILDANYRVDSCPIQSVNCILLPVEAIPQQNPLRDLAIGQAHDDSDDADVLLPNVAEQDY